MRPVFDAVTQDIDSAALADLALETGQELAPRGPVGVQFQRLGDPWLGLGQK